MDRSKQVYRRLSPGLAGGLSAESIAGWLIKTVLVAGYLAAAHGVGPWAVLPWFTPLILGGSIDVGTGGIRAIGLAWPALSAAFAVAAVVALMRPPWWQPFVRTCAGLSLTLCVAGWPDTGLGSLPTPSCWRCS